MIPDSQDVFYQQTLIALRETLAEMAPNEKIDPLTECLTLGQPPQFNLGQAAIACHPLAKKLRINPVKIAQSLADLISKRPYPLISRVEAINGYLNFHCHFLNYAPVALEEIRGGAYFKRNLLPKELVDGIVVEFSQPNTHKALHIGHLRNMVYGDAVCNLLDRAGHRVIRATYPGDLGTHIAKTLLYIKKHHKGPLPTQNRADWLGERYRDADAYVTGLEGKPEAAQLKGEIAKVLSELQHQKGEYFTFYQETREWSLEQMQDIYQWLGIRFDVWYFESECDEPSRVLVQKKYQEGFFALSEGAIGIDLNAFNLGFALFLKSDGTGLYLTKDLELIRRKFEDPSVTRSIVIVDSRQKLHFKQLFKTAELMGYPQAARSEHLSYETVTTEDGLPFSSRSLTGMPLSELKKIMEEKITTDYLSRYRGEWSDEEIQSTASMIALGAIKFGFLRVDGNCIIRFVLNDWLKLDGETGPYLQYVHARCASLLKKIGVPEKKFEIVLESEVEQELLFGLRHFNRAVLHAAETYRPSVVAAFLYDICKLFNRFYTDCPIKTAVGDQKNTRLALVESTAAVLKEGLKLLGIPAPNKM